MAKVTACERIEPLLAPWADGSLAADETPAVEAHLRACAACQELASTGREVHELLRARADRLREQAPAALRERLAARRGRSAGQARRLGLLARWVPASAAAAVLLAIVSVVAVGSLGSGRVLAAQLTLDHLKCLLIADTGHAADATRLAETWARDRGWSIRVPPSSTEARVTLAAMRRCLYGDGEMAHLIYERDGQPVSLFILPRPREAAPVLAIMGHETITWAGDGRTYAVVGKLSREELSLVAAYLRPLAR